MRYFALINLLMIMALGRATAQETGSGLDFLNIGPSAAQLSISEASSAASVGAAAIYSNPAMLAFEERSSLDVNYSLWIADVNNQFAGVNFVRNRAALAIGVYNSSADGFEARDRPGPSAGQFSVGYLSLSGAAAYRMGPLSIGGTAQFLREEVFQFRATGYAVSAGTALQLFENRLRAGAVIRNLGEMESLDEQSTKLPATFSAGISADVLNISTSGNNDFPVLVTLLADYTHRLEEPGTGDFVSSDSDDPFISVATQITAAELLFVNGGYRFGPTERPLSFGGGLLLDSITVRYALVPFSTGFGTVHSFGLQYHF
jgi:hypothetical protein